MAKDVAETTGLLGEVAHPGILSILNCIELHPYMVLVCRNAKYGFCAPPGKNTILYKPFQKSV